MNHVRRTLVGAAGLGALAGAAHPATDDPLQPDTVPALPDAPPPGAPGDFDFLDGHWRIRHRRLPPGAAEWDHFEGEATCRTLLGGIGSVEELRIPERGFSGMGLRLLDVQRRVWSDFWVNARSGVLTPPGQEGGFVGGAGLFWSDEVDEQGRTVRHLGVWDRITPTSCRWRQVSSSDGGRTWLHHWLMDWRRA